IIDQTPEKFVTGMEGSEARVHTPKAGDTLSF
ncbi:MAG: metal-dependent hydrolase, partial [Rhizobium oryzihabitans]